MTTHKKAAGESGSIAKQSVMPIVAANSPIAQTNQQQDCTASLFAKIALMVCGIASNAAQVYRIKTTTEVLSIALSVQKQIKVVNNP